MKKIITAALIGLSCASYADHCDKCKDYHRHYSKRTVKATCSLCGTEFQDEASMCWYPCAGRSLPSQYERNRKRYCKTCSSPRWLEPQARSYATQTTQQTVTTLYNPKPGAPSFAEREALQRPVQRRLLKLDPAS